MKSSNNRYQAPKLTAYGTFRELTQLLGSVFQDGPSGDNNANPPRS